MSPLKRWFRGHHMPGWYSWVVVVGMTLTMSAGSMLVTLKSAERAVRAERAARVASQEDGRRATCVLVRAQDDAFSDPDSRPVTEAGKKAAAAWHDMREIFRCDER